MTVNLGTFILYDEDANPVRVVRWGTEHTNIMGTKTVYTYSIEETGEVLRQHTENPQVYESVQDGKLYAKVEAD